MLFDYIFFLKNYNALFLNASNNSIFKYIIPLTGDVMVNKPEFFLELHNTKQQFCFSFTAGMARHSNNFIKEEIIQHLVRMLFLPNYIRLAGKYLFFFEKAEEGNDRLDLLKNELVEELGKQGIKDILFEMIDIDAQAENLPGENAVSVNNPHLNNYLKHSAVAVNYNALVKKFNMLAYFNKQLVVPIETPDDLQYKITLIEHFENWIKLTEPLKVKLIKTHTLADQEKTALKKENELLKIKLQNSAGYLKEIKQQVQWQSTNQTDGDSIPADFFSSNDPDGFIMQLQARLTTEKKHSHTILEWYKKEYEVLPMWYKRFGHIIKVIMGKRTFKSLFK
jgi:hypothetical protein